MDENKEINPYLLTLIDEDGAEHVFEELDKIELTDDNDEEVHYIAVTPYNPNPDEVLEAYDELLILKEISEDGIDVTFTLIEDEDELNEIYTIFEERLAEYYVGGDEE